MTCTKATNENVIQYTCSKKKNIVLIWLYETKIIRPCSQTEEAATVSLFHVTRNHKAHCQTREETDRILVPRVYSFFSHSGPEMVVLSHGFRHCQFPFTCNASNLRFELRNYYLFVFLSERKVAQKRKKKTGKIIQYMMAQQQHMFWTNWHTKAQ